MKILITLLLSTAFLHAGWENLWPGEAPGAKRPPAGTETVKEGGRISGVEVPQYFLYQPEAGKANGAAVVIFPGGGYSILAADHEGSQYAEWLTQRGFTAIVVKYRVGAGLGYQYPTPFLDARRAIRTVRSRAADWNLKPDRIGVMGSSAGGHLASLCATRFNDTFDEETKDEIDKLSARPDFAILCYPVITMEPIGHAGSRTNLAGKEAAPEMIKTLSTEKAVSAETPPTFLLSTSDDGVDCRNSMLFATALREHKVPFALHIFEKGGHGYGLNGKGPLGGWPLLLDAWLAERWKD
jgi:acetyl esterase/lipase